MSGLLTTIWQSTAFQSGLWLFIGIVAGALIQHALNYLTIKYQRSNALAALRTEVEINLGELDRFRQRLIYLRNRISAGQIEEKDLFVSMQGFDYSIVSPLVNSGHFHLMLGPENTKKYFEFMRFFNNNNARVVNSMLSTEHSVGKSLDYIDYLSNKCDELDGTLTSLREAKSKRGRLLSPSNRP